MGNVLLRGLDLLHHWSESVCPSIDKWGPRSGHLRCRLQDRDAYISSAKSSSNSCPDDCVRAIYDSLVLAGAKGWSDYPLPVSLHSLHTQIALKVEPDQFGVFIDIPLLSLRVASLRVLHNLCCDSGNVPVRREALHSAESFAGGHLNNCHRSSVRIFRSRGCGSADI